MYKVLGADQKEYGPVSAEQIHQWIRDRRLNAQSLVMTEGAVGWKPLSFFPEFASSLAAAGLSAPLPPQSQPGAGGVVTGGALPQTNSFAIAGMCLGIFALVVTCCCYGMPFNILGLIFSILGLNQIKRSSPPQKGREMAITGIILSVISLVLGLLVLILGMAMNLPQVLDKIKGKF